MNLSALARRTITRWLIWRAKRAMYRAVPELRELDRRQSACRRSHKRGAAAIDREKFLITTAALAGKTP